MVFRWLELNGNFALGFRRFFSSSFFFFFFTVLWSFVRSMTNRKGPRTVTSDARFRENSITCRCARVLNKPPGNYTLRNVEQWRPVLQQSFLTSVHVLIGTSSLRRNHYPLIIRTPAANENGASHRTSVQFDGQNNKPFLLGVIIINYHLENFPEETATHIFSFEFDVPRFFFLSFFLLIYLFVSCRKMLDRFAVDRH